MPPSPSAADHELALVTVIVKPFRVEAVLHALRAFDVHSLTLTQVRGYGRQKGHLELYRGQEYAISFIPKIKLEVVVPRAEQADMERAVAQAARTGRIGDGKLFFLEVETFESL
jgi:nitrogen regulatory protein P-II 2